MWDSLLIKKERKIWLWPLLIGNFIVVILALLFMRLYPNEPVFFLGAGFVYISMLWILVVRYEKYKSITVSKTTKVFIVILSVFWLFGLVGSALKHWFGLGMGNGITP